MGFNFKDMAGALFRAVTNQPVVLPPKAKKNPLDLAYNTQRDNNLRPNGECNVTSLQMVLSPGSSVTDNELMKRANSAEMKKWAWKMFPNDAIKKAIDTDRLNTVWEVLERLAAQEVGAQNAKFKKFPVDDAIATIKAEIDLGYPTVFGGAFTAAGHIVVAVGYNEKGIICHDPFGKAPGYKDRDGAYVLYEYAYLRKIMSGRTLRVHADRRVPVK